MFRQLSTAALVLVAIFPLIIAVPGCNNRASSSTPDARPSEAGAGGEPQAVPRGTASTQQTAAVSKTQSQQREIAVDLGDGVKLEMVLIPAGEFLMGSPDSDKDAEPRREAAAPGSDHQAVLPGQVSGDAGAVGSGDGQAIRATSRVRRTRWRQVSWDDCQQFLEQAQREVAAGGGKFQLPTEAQWEYACRAGSTTRYCFGDDESRLGEYAWYEANSGDTDASCWREEAERLGAVRHARERMGVVPGLV